jgi:hypothetical protein
MLADTPAAHIAAAWGALRISWRDAVLDRLVVTLAKNQATARQGRRLGRYLENARAIESQEWGGWDGERSIRRLTEWTAERLRELERKRVESALHPVKIEWLKLTGEFSHAQREEHPNLAAWRKRVRAAEENLIHDGLVRRSRLLTPAERDEVLFTEGGKIRAPRSMAFRLICFFACPSRMAAEAFRIQLEHVKLRPTAL